MPTDQGHSLWSTVKSWFARQAEHVTVEFLADPSGEPLYPQEGYLRLWLAEGFLGQGVSWTNEHFPVLHGGVTLNFGQTGVTAFSTFTQRTKDVTTPGAYLDYELTPLVPFIGGTVEVQAALYRTTVAGPLSTAVALAGNLASLVGPPLSAAAGIVDKVSTGLGQVLAASKDEPVLAVHRTLVSPGGVGGPTELRPGLLVVVDRPRAQLGGRLAVDDDGRVGLTPGNGAPPVPPTGVNYLALRIECRTDRDDWQVQALDALIKAARSAALEGNPDLAQHRRLEALLYAWNSPDLAEADRPRVADLVEKRIDAATRQGITPEADLTFGEAAKRYLLNRDAPELDDLTFAKQLARSRV